jgi:adenine deaminase
MALTRAELERRIDQAQGRDAADLVVKGARLLNTATGTLDEGDIAVCGAVIVATHGSFRGRREIDAKGLIAVPGFVDAHVHIESSLVLPDRFARAVLPRGTTTAIWDPHEIANVTGMAGLRWALAAARPLPMTVLVALSSCVPSSPLETSGARLEVADLLTLAGEPGVVGLAELMSFPGVLAKDPGLLDKLAAFALRHIDGHAPLLSGRALDAYLACGVRTDHECTTLEEGREKQAKGMHILLREGSLSKDVAALAPLIRESTWPFLAFCTDDRNPLEIALEGHIDAAIRKAIALGAPTIPTYRAATLGACLAFGLRDRGLVAPGRRADIVLLGDLDTCAVVRVIAGGRLVEDALFEGVAAPEPVGRGSVRRGPVTEADFRIPAGGASPPVIGVREGSLLTDRLDLELAQVDGLRVADSARGLLKVAVLERHGRNGNLGRGFVSGFGPLQGALGTSVGHDSHNLTVIGANDADMAAAVNRLIALQGGLVAVQGGRVLAELALPVGGLMSTAPLDEVGSGLARLLAAARAMGATLAEPFLQMAFLPLPVIPHLKITDRGLVDVDRFALIGK